MLELIYRDRIYITGTVAQLRQRLSEHAKNYSTVAELIKDLSPS